MTKFFKCAAVPVSKGAVSPLNKTAPWVEKKVYWEPNCQGWGGMRGDRRAKCQKSRFYIQQGGHLFADAGCSDLCNQELDNFV